MKFLNIYYIKNRNSFGEHGLQNNSSKLHTDLSVDGMSNSNDIATAFRGFMLIFM